MEESILFVCNMNAVRSPMAAALMAALVPPSIKIDSAGLVQGAQDPFAHVVLAEKDLSLGDHAPKTLDAIDLNAFSLIIVLTTRARARLAELIPDGRVEMWDVENPSHEHGSRETILEAYRRVRDELSGRIAKRFPRLQEKP